MPYVEAVGNGSFIDLRKDRPSDRPDILQAPSVRVVGLRDETDLSFLEHNRQLRILQVMDAHHLAGLERLAQVRELMMQHLPNLRSLRPLEALRDLTRLHISTDPSWDGSGKLIEVESLAPLSSLTRLRRLTLLGVAPADRSLVPLHSLRQLEHLEIGGTRTFGVEDYAVLSRHLPVTKGKCLQPCYTFNFATWCSKCGQRTVILTGAPPRGRQALCPTCNRDRLHDHVRRWNAAGGRPFSPPRKAEDVSGGPPHEG